LSLFYRFGKIPGQQLFSHYHNAVKQDHMLHTGYLFKISDRGHREKKAFCRIRKKNEGDVKNIIYLLYSFSSSVFTYLVTYPPTYLLYSLILSPTHLIIYSPIYHYLLVFINVFAWTLWINLTTLNTIRSRENVKI